MKNANSSFGTRGIFTLLVLIVVLSWQTQKIFSLDFAPVHDYAADMLLGNIIRDEGILLVGHYSRFGFHHPGPFWFYWNQLIELCLNWLPLTRLQIWAIGSIVINSALLFFSGLGLSKYLFDRIKYQTVFILTAMLLITVGGDFLATWMPNRLIATYIAFFVCLLNISRANLSYLPWATLLSAMLIHGYVTMPILTIPPLILSFAAALFLKRNEIKRRELYIQLTQSFVIAALFIVPIAADTLLLSASNFSKIIAAHNALMSSPKPSWFDLLGFYKQLVFDQPYSYTLYLASLLGLIPLLLLRERKVLIRIGGIVILFLFISTLVVVYYKTTPAPLYPFVARFYVGLPCIVTASVWCALIERLGHFSYYWNLISKICVIMMLAGGVIFSKQHINPIWADPKDASPIRAFADYIKQETKDDRVIVLNYSQHEQWGIMAGLMVELDRHHKKSCTTWMHMGFLYTQRMICPIDSKADYMVVKSTECDTKCVVQNNGLGLKSIK